MYGGRLEPVRRPVEDVFVDVGRSETHTLEQNRVWFRRPAKKLEDAKLAKRVYASTAPKGVLFLQLMPRGMTVMKDLVSDEQQEEVPIPAVEAPAKPAPAVPPERPAAVADAESTDQAVHPASTSHPTTGSEPTLESIRRDIKRLRELDTSIKQIELSVIVREGVEPAIR